jgi:hypothetical protein
LIKRLFAVLGGITLAAAALTPALAKAHLVYQQGSVFGNSAVYVSRGLLPGHRYRIDVVSNGHIKIAALGTQQITYVEKGRMGTLAKPVKFVGTTPYSHVLKQPASIRALAWIFAMQVSDAVRKPLTVKLYDLGRAK